MPDSERREQVRALLSSVGMEKDFEKMPSEISGGMQKRVGLARALALIPKYCCSTSRQRGSIRSPPPKSAA